jgi:hypothetical protein
MSLTRRRNWRYLHLQFGGSAYSQAYLQPYLEEHGRNLQRLPQNSCFECAAHALVTGVGLLILLDFRAPSTPLMIINMVYLRWSALTQANIRQVDLNGSKFTVKTDDRNYVFNAGTRERAQIWKTELESRTPQARYTITRFLRSPEYHDALETVKEGISLGSQLMRYRGCVG